jgi:hypothetical protein
MNDKLRAAAKAALSAMSVVRVFVTSKEKIKHPEGTDWYDNIISNLKAALAEPTVQKSLTAQRPWVGLTDEEINLIYDRPHIYFTQYAKDIEAKLREKNT